MADDTIKMYCYVDESGQHAAMRPDQAHIFVVATAIFEHEQRDQAESACASYERASGKDKRKWSHCVRESKMSYARMILEDDLFKQSLCYSVARFVGKADYDVRTILSIAKAVQWRQPHGNYDIEIYVDGLTTVKRAEYSLELRKLGVHLRRVHLARDESYALIRLADAVAGLTREAEEGQEDAIRLVRRGVRRSVLVQV